MGDSCEHSSKEEKKGIRVSHVMMGNQEPRRRIQTATLIRTRSMWAIAGRADEAGSSASGSFYSQAAAGRKSLWKRTTGVSLRGRRWLSCGASGAGPSLTDSAYVVPKCS